MNNRTGELFLFSKMFRLLNPMEDYKPNYDEIRFRRCRFPGHKEALWFVSGVFYDRHGHSFFPFNLAFRSINGLRCTGLSQLAVHGRIDTEGRRLVLMAILDYLVSADKLQATERDQMFRRLCSHNLTGDLNEKYHALCQRAAKDLPYDMEQEINAARGHSQALAA